MIPQNVKMIPMMAVIPMTQVAVPETPREPSNDAMRKIMLKNVIGEAVATGLPLTMHQIVSGIKRMSRWKPDAVTQLI